MTGGKGLFPAGNTLSFFCTFLRERFAERSFFPTFAGTFKEHICVIIHSIF